MSSSFDWESLNSPRSLGKKGTSRTFCGTFVRFGKKYREGPGAVPVYERKILLKKVESLDRRFGTDHLWIDYYPEFQAAKPGDQVQFTGTVATYSGKYKKDNHLINICNIILKPTK